MGKGRSWMVSLLTGVMQSGGGEASRSVGWRTVLFGGAGGVSCQSKLLPPIPIPNQVLEHLFHFIARSFALHSHGRTAGDETLKMSLNHFFNGLVSIMRAPTDEKDKGRRILDMQVSRGREQLP